MICGLPSATNIAEPDRAPLTVGANWIVIVHVEPPDSEEGQSVEPVKSAPTIMRLPILRSPLPVFETFTVAWLTVPTRLGPKLKVVVDSVKGATPFPERLTALLPELLPMVS